MKLRNKKTGKIRDFEFIAITKDMDAKLAKYAYHAPVLICRSIDQLNEEWEDYDEKAEEEAIAMLKLIAKSLDIDISKLCGKDEE